MKCLIFCIFLTTAIAIDQETVDRFIEKMTTIGGECAEETHASDDDIAQLIERKRPTTHEGQCMVFCVQRKLHTMKEDGTIDQVGSVLALDEAVRDADFELYKKMLTVFVKCGENAKIYDDPCETATGLFMCGNIEAKNAGIDIGSLG